MATDNPLGLEPSELAASKRAKEAAAARAAANATPTLAGAKAAGVLSSSTITTPNSSAISRPLRGLTPQMIEDMDAADAALVDAFNPASTDIGLADLGTEDPVTGVITLSGTAEADVAEQAANTAAIAAGGDPAIFGDDAGLTQAKVDKATPIDPTLKDAYALLEDAFNQYGLGELASVIKGYMQSGIGPNEAKLLLKQNPIYQQRFAGLYDKNFGRVANGLMQSVRLST